MNPLIQLDRQLHYLFAAFLFASFPVARSVQAEPDDDSPNVEEGAALGKAVNQRIIRFAYTDLLPCGFSEQVKLHGKMRILFKQNGRKVTASLGNFEGFGLTT